MQTRNVAVMMTDIKGFTARTSESTREGVVKLVAEHDRLLRPVFARFRGQIVKTIGDAFLVWFDSPTDAVLCGLTIQEVLRQHNARSGEKDRLQIRVAINSGEVEVRDGDIFGEPVNLAARLEGIAEPGEVWFTEAVHLTMNRAEVPSAEVGVREFKGIPTPVKVYKVVDDPNSVQLRELASQVRLENGVPTFAASARRRPPARLLLAGGGVLGAVLLAGGALWLYPALRDHLENKKVETLLDQQEDEDAWREADAYLKVHPGDAPLRALGARALVRWQRLHGRGEHELFDRVGEFVFQRFPQDPEVAWAAGEELDKQFIASAVLAYWGHSLEKGGHRSDPEVFEHCLKAFQSDPPEELPGVHKIARTWFDRERVDWAAKTLAVGPVYPFLNAWSILQEKGDPAPGRPVPKALHDLFEAKDADAPALGKILLAATDPGEQKLIGSVLGSGVRDFSFTRGNKESVDAIWSQAKARWALPEPTATPAE